MPSGAKKRKAAKKKKVNDSSTTNPHQAGENDGGELSSPTSQDPSVEVEKREDSNVEIETGSKSKSSSGSSSSSSDSSDDDSHTVEKNVVVLESAPDESLKPVDSLLEQVSQVFDEIKNEKKKDLVVEQQAVVVSETAMKDDCPTSSVVAESVQENEVERLILLDDKASSVSKDYLPSSTHPENLISGVNGADCANETDTVEHSNRQAPAASTTVAVQSTTTWKSCCGIFELFSRS